MGGGRPMEGVEHGISSVLSTHICNIYFIYFVADGSGQTPLYAPRITVPETPTPGSVGGNSPYRLNSPPHLAVPSAEGGPTPGSPSYLSPCFLTVPPAGAEGAPGTGGSVSAPTSPYSRRNNPPSPHLSVPDPPPGPAHHSAGSSPYHISTPPPYPNQVRLFNVLVLFGKTAKQVRFAGA